MSIAIDWSKVPDQQERVLIPQGTYPATIFAADTKFSAAGNEMVVLTVRLSNAPYNGQRLTSYYPITDKALWKLKALLQSCGFADSLQGEEDFDPNVLLDQEVLVRVIHEEYNGETRSKADSMRGTHAGQVQAQAAVAQIAARQRLNGAPPVTSRPQPFAGPAPGGAAPRPPAAIRQAVDFLNDSVDLDTDDLPF